ncbi:N-fatty-acyl-amino acid synthase/hydrolase PM20D1.2 [Scleropages formosus]|uniref:Peptidase M20 domain containing 1, tandem duplicate 1 n=1 Tax=Scleropages formosus TaxID=113540 RepID=A0A8C9RXL7_SCLFO|nr:N-fatty-acyl-amino acid synthase/hydrolase PM20D1 [Scleropages formosus]XP_018617736.2 N-fatty-acyl-amino acid synthase/hydrolase PM20D1 [Scleropages formosus]
MAGYPALVKVRTLAKFAVLSSALLAAALLLAATIRTLTLDVSAGLHIAKWEKIVYVPSDISGPQREHLLANLKAAIQIPTVSFSDYEQNVTALEEFGRLLRRAFPTVFSSSRVRYEVVSNYSHLFWVPGSDPSLEPYMLLAHIDVVPAFEADGWDAPPFSGREVDGFIYGRGTIDNKQSVMGILQALEFLLERGYAPRRGFYIGLGHDEEINGHFGAANIVKLLQSRGVSLAFVLDEGSAILDGVIHGLESPVAMIAVTEKGMASVKLSVTTLPGHSSMPPAETSIGILASAVTRLEKNPLPLLFGHGPERDMFEHLAHKFEFPLKFVMSNLWLFGPLLVRVMQRRPDSNALVRTTTAVTKFNAGVKINVMPPYAEAFVNLRIHPAQTVEEVLELIRLTVNDERVKIELDRGFDPLPVSSFDDKSFGYQIVKKTLLDMFPQISVAPGVCVGNTDSRHYNSLTKDIYRFTPTWFKPGDEKRFHGVNERISMRNYEEIVHFYFQLFQNCDTRKLPESHSAQHDL